MGGSAYSNAPQIGAGTWSDSVAIGETAVYRVRLDHGQRFRITASAPAGSEDAGLISGEAVTTRVTLFSPARLAMTTTYQSATVDAPARVTAASPEVRVRNRETPLPVAGNAAADWSTASVAGDYFVGVQLDPIQKYLAGRVMSVRLSIAVEGTPAGQPEYASAPSSASPSPTGSAATATASPSDATGSAAPSSPARPGADTGGSGGRSFALGLVGGVLVAVLAAAALWATRRQARKNTHNSRENSDSMT